jgi:hypothetical protein
MSCLGSWKGTLEKFERGISKSNVDKYKFIEGNL